MLKELKKSNAIVMINSLSDKKIEKLVAEINRLADNDECKDIVNLLQFLYYCGIKGAGVQHISDAIKSIFITRYNMAKKLKISKASLKQYRKELEHSKSMDQSDVQRYMEQSLQSKWTREIPDDDETLYYQLYTAYTSNKINNCVVEFLSYIWQVKEDEIMHRISQVNVELLKNTLERKNRKVDYNLLNSVVEQVAENDFKIRNVRPVLYFPKSRLAEEYLGALDIENELLKTVREWMSEEQKLANTLEVAVATVEKYIEQNLEKLEAMSKSNNDMTKIDDVENIDTIESSTGDTQEKDKKDMKESNTMIDYIMLGNPYDSLFRLNSMIKKYGTEAELARVTGEKEQVLINLKYTLEQATKADELQEEIARLQDKIDELNKSKLKILKCNEEIMECFDGDANKALKSLRQYHGNERAKVIIVEEGN